MTRLLNMILRHLAGTGQTGSRKMTAEEKAAHKRVRKAIKATRRMHRI